MYFHNAINKYGAENFLFKKIDEAKTQEELDNKERYWIKYYNSNNKDKGYNLDSGGRSGGIKSDETKRKIGETTKEKWKNPEMAAKMRYGLTKGTETVKKNVKKYPFTCPVCHKTFYYQKHIAESKKFCSIQCSAKTGSWKKGVKASAEANHLKNIQFKSKVRQDINEWILSHENIVLSCPYNKITPTLKPLLTLIEEKYNIKDIRTLFICYEGVNSRKTFLDKLKNIIYISKENVC